MPPVYELDYCHWSASVVVDGKQLAIFNKDHGADKNDDKGETLWESGYIVSEPGKNFEVHWRDDRKKRNFSTCASIFLDGIHVGDSIISEDSPNTAIWDGRLVSSTQFQRPYFNRILRTNNQTATHDADTIERLGQIILELSDITIEESMDEPEGDHTATRLPGEDSFYRGLDFKQEHCIEFDPACQRDGSIPPLFDWKQTQLYPDVRFIFHYDSSAVLREKGVTFESKQANCAAGRQTAQRAAAEERSEKPSSKRPRQEVGDREAGGSRSAAAPDFGDPFRSQRQFSLRNLVSRSKEQQPQPRITGGSSLQDRRPPPPASVKASKTTTVASSSRQTQPQPRIVEVSGSAQEKGRAPSVKSRDPGPRETPRRFKSEPDASAHDSNVIEILDSDEETSSPAKPVKREHPPGPSADPGPSNQPGALAASNCGGGPSWEERSSFADKLLRDPDVDLGTKQAVLKWLSGS